MKVIQRNNKYSRVRFSNVGIGHRFSLGPGSTPLVKVSNDTFGVLAPGFGPDNVKGVQLPTGVVPYYIPTFNTVSDGTIVFDPDSNPSASGGVAEPPNGSVILVDPPFYNGQSNYLMEAEFDPVAGTVDLEWSYPNLRSGFGTGPGQATLHVTHIVLQRSSTTRATPWGPTGDGPVNAFYNPSRYNDVIADPAWVTLFDEPSSYVIAGPPPYPLTETYQDIPPITNSSHIFHYRLIVFITVQPFLVPVSIPYEVDWNSVTIVAPFTLNVGGNPRLGWSTPSAVELASLSRLFLNSFSAVRSGITFATTEGGFEMPAADDATESADVAVSSNSFITVGQKNGYVMSDVGVVKLIRGSAPNTIRVINPGYGTNVSPGSNVPSGKIISSTTELTWVYDLSEPPTGYLLQKSYDGVSYSTVASLPADFTQPFKDEDPPNPTVYYKLLTIQPAGSEGIPYDYGLTYAARSVT